MVLVDKFVDALRKKLDYIAKLEELPESEDGKWLKGIVKYAEPDGRFYLVEITHDGVLNGTIAFASYGDVAKYEGILNQALRDKHVQVAENVSTHGSQFKEGDNVKFCVAFTLKAFHLAKA